MAFAEVERQQRALLPEIEAKIDQLWADRKAIKLIESHEVIHRETRRLLREAMSLGLKLQSKDAIHLASARNVKASRLHTFDADLGNSRPLWRFRLKNLRCRNVSRLWSLLERHCPRYRAITVL